MVQFPTYFPIEDGLISLPKYCMMILCIQNHSNMTPRKPHLSRCVVPNHRVTFLGRKTISSSSLGDSFEAGRSELDGAKIFPGSHRLFKPGSSPPEQFEFEGPEKTASEKKNTCELFLFFGLFAHVYICLLWKMRCFVFVFWDCDG